MTNGILHYILQSIRFTVAIATMAVAADLNADNETQTFVIPGEEATFQNLMPRWIACFPSDNTAANTDEGNQNSWSIAMDEAYVYVAVDWYNATYKGKLFLRRFDKATGEHTLFTTPYPAAFSDSNYKGYPSIFNDESHHIFLAKLYYNSNLQLHLFLFDANSQSFASTPKIINLGVTSNVASPTKIQMDNISEVSGDITSDNYRLTCVFSCDNNPDPLIKYYINVISNDAVDASFLLPTATKSIFTNTMTGWNNGAAFISVCRHPQNQNIAILTAKDTSAKFPPVLYNRTESNYIKFQPQTGTWDYSYIRGVYSFLYHGVPMFVMGSKNNGGEAQFCLFTIPAEKTLAESMEGASLLATFPPIPMKTYGKMYGTVRQLAISEPVNAPKSRVDFNNEKSDVTLYVYAPSAGMAAYKLTSSDMPTSVETVTDDDHPIHICGTTLFTGIYNGIVNIFTPGGRNVSQCRSEDGRVDLSFLPKGLYIVKAGNHAIKFVR